MDAVRNAVWPHRRTWLAVIALVALAPLGWRSVQLAITYRRPYALAALVTACLTVMIAAKLSATLRASERNAAELTDAYVQAQREIGRLQQSYRERLHDARSAAASVRGAARLLAAPAAGRPAERGRLRHVLAAELDRMQAVLAAAPNEPAACFDLVAAFGPVIDAHRLAGMRINYLAEAATVDGRAHAIATVLDNLLRNVATHAPGAAVRIRVTASARSVTVVVDDDGPGIPEAERASALLPGVRGSGATAPGDGLGLHTALATVTAQSGQLDLGRSPSGGTRVVITLPVSAPATDPTPVRALAS